MYYRTQTNTENRLFRVKYLRLRKVMIHTSYFNVSASIGNNLLFYDVATSFLLSDGYYDQDGLNVILKRLGYYKLIINEDCQNMDMWKFSNLNDWLTENVAAGVIKTPFVYDQSPLNININNITFFSGITMKMNFYNTYTTQQSLNQLTVGQTVQIPIEAP